jgi:DNA polymerase-3 subunit epsilon
MLGHTKLDGGSFVAVDIETTGGRPGTSDIIEIGAARVEKGAIVGRFQELVRPTEPIPCAIQTLTGISDAMVADAPDLELVLPRFRDFAAGAVLVAHNHRFDMGFLDYEAERLWGLPFERPVLDTLAMSRRLHPELPRHNLRELASHFGAETVPNHRALPDALATCEVLREMLAELVERGLRTAADAADFCGLATQGILSRKLVLASDVPDAPGIYVLRSESGEVLYLGRARSLRSRVRSHFYAPSDPSHPGAATETASIDHVVLESALDAMLVESRLLERYKPRFNRDYGRTKPALYFHIDLDSEFPTMRVTKRPLRVRERFGPVVNEWAADTVAEAVRVHFGLRRCRRPFPAAVDAETCRHRDGASCPAPCRDGIGQAEYVKRAAAAAAALDGDAQCFRDAIQALRERAAADERYEDAIGHRDAIRAFDRTRSALDLDSRVRETPALALVEWGERTIVVHLVRLGYLFRTLRIDLAEVRSEGVAAEIRRAMTRAYGSLDAPHVARLTPRRLRDTFIIDTHRRQHEPVAHVLGDDLDKDIAKVIRMVRRETRTPRPRREARQDA